MRQQWLERIFHGFSLSHSGMTTWRRVETESSVAQFLRRKFFWFDEISPPSDGNFFLWLLFIWFFPFEQSTWAKLTIFFSLRYCILSEGEGFVVRLFRLLKVAWKSHEGRKVSKFRSARVVEWSAEGRKVAMFCFDFSISHAKSVCNPRQWWTKNFLWYQNIFFSNFF